LSTINHELKTPLVPIKAYIDMLYAGHFGELNDVQKKRLGIILLSVQQIQQKIETLHETFTASNKMITNEATDHYIKELEQKTLLLKKISELLDTKEKEKDAELEKLKSSFVQSEHHKKEFEQQKFILDKTVKHEEQKNLNLSKKHIMTIAGAVVVIGIIMTAYSLYVVDLVGQEYRVEDLGALKSSYVIQNLKGDRVDTWLSWRLTQGATLYVNILNAQQHPEKAETVKDVILSKEYYEIDDHLLGKAPKGTITKYYLGWAGALEVASQTPTKFPVPANIQVTDSATGAGDITITLANTRSGDGYAGITKSIADESQNQILKSDITIYDVENLSENQLMAIVRHELGHAFGLAHSTATEDLMHPELVSEYPYISHCDITAIVELYDGSQKSEVVCEK